MVRAGADFSGMRKSMQKAQQDIQSFKKGVSTAMKAIAATMAAVGGVAVFAKATRSAMDFEASIMQINRMMGNNAKAFDDWAKANAAALGMSRVEATKYGATFGNLISSFEKDTVQLSKHTQDLLKASAVISSATGRTIEDTMERIRSGMLGSTEAIEDLGINVGISMIESTEAFKRFAGDKSWAQLDFQTQQQIRLFAILEQATTKYGDEVANNTNSQMNRFIASLKNVQLSLGQAFLPILNIVLPLLTRMANALATAANVVAQFSQALFGKAPEKQAQAQAAAVTSQASAVEGLGDAYKSAAKAAKGSVAGFDEVNDVTSSSSGGGGDVASELAAASAGGGLPAIDMGGGLASSTVEVSEKVQAMATKFREAVTGIKNAVVENKEIIIAGLAGIGAGLATLLIATNWTSIVSGLSASFVALGAAARAAWLAVTGPIGLVVAAIALVTGAFVYFYQTNESFRGVVDGILQKIGEVASWLWNEVLVPLGSFLAETFVKAWEGVTTAASWLWENVLVPFGTFLEWLWKEVITPLATIIGEGLAIAFETVSDIAKSFWENVLVPLGKAFSEMFGPAVEAVSTVLGFLWEKVFVPLGKFLSETMMPIWEDIIDVITVLWKEVLKPVSEFVGGLFFTAFDSVFKSIGEIIDGLKETFIGLMTFITGVFSGDWQKAWDGVKQVFKGVFDSFEGIVKTPLNLVIDLINKMLDGINKIKIDVPEWAEKLTGFSTFGFSIPKIPRLARGGIVNGTTNMGNYIAGEAGAEMIVPLENTSFTDKIASALGNAVMTAMQMGQGGNGGDTIIQMNGVEVARVLRPYMEGEQGRVGGTMIRAT